MSQTDFTPADLTARTLQFYHTDIPLLIAFQDVLGYMPKNGATAYELARVLLTHGCFDWPNDYICCPWLGEKVGIDYHFDATNELSVSQVAANKELLCAIGKKPPCLMKHRNPWNIEMELS